MAIYKSGYVHVSLYSLGYFHFFISYSYSWLFNPNYSILEIALDSLPYPLYVSSCRGLDWADMQIYYYALLASYPGVY